MSLIFLVNAEVGSEQHSKVDLTERLSGGIHSALYPRDRNQKEIKDFESAQQNYLGGL
jgi:hypothetical protein